MISVTFMAPSCPPRAATGRAPHTHRGCHDQIVDSTGTYVMVALIDRVVVVEA
jgi:hypothetical protein